MPMLAGRTEGLPANVSASKRKSPHAARKAKIAAVATAGLATGMTTDRSTLTDDAPSTRADSMSSCGIDSM